MAKPKTSNKKKKGGLLTLKDIKNGFTSLTQSHDIWTLAPVQCIPLDEKDPDWIRWNADWFENIALRELPTKARKYEKFYMMAQGKICKSDYIINPELNEMTPLIEAVGEKEFNPLQQFFPVVPNIINVFLGEQLRRDNRIIVDAVDPESINEAYNYKYEQTVGILEQNAMMKKQFELIKLGLIPQGPQDPVTQKIQQEMMAAKEMADAQVKFQNFRTIGADWGQKFIEKYQVMHGMDEMIMWGFFDSLVVDEVIFALNLREDNFTPERLETKKTYVNKSPGQRYYSKANFIVNIDFKSLPDIINEYKNDLTDKQIEALEEQYGDKTTRDILFADQYGHSDTYYDTSKSMEQNLSVSPAVKETLSDRAIKNFLFNPSEVTGSTEYSGMFGNQRFIRVSRIWWPSQRKIGLLTRVDENGNTTVDDVDENFIVTDKPVYNKSLLNEESAKTLVSGEHVDWKYTNEWRYVVKIGDNRPYWYVGDRVDWENIYLYGDPIRFQFKNNRSLFDAKPPIEGCRISSNSTISVGLVEKIRPWQILYNVLNNKGFKTMAFDRGKVLHANASNLQRNTLLQDAGRLEPLFDFLDQIKESKIIINDNSPDTRQFGTPLQPTVVDLSEIEQAALYFQTAQFVKQQAFESIGVSPQRAADVEASTSATGVQQAVQGSVNQTEIYFDLYNNKLMPRVFQLILDAGQYYSTLSDEFSDTYINSDLHKVYFGALNNDLLLRDFCVMAQSSATMRKMMDELRQLSIQDNTMGATFLDKVKSLVSTNPTQLITQLEEAQAKVQAQEQEKYKQEQALQQQQQEFLLAQQQREQQLQNTQFYDQLKNDRILAEMKTGSTEAPPVDPLKQQQVENQQASSEAQNDMKERQMQQQQQMNDQKMQLEREKMNQKDREIASKEFIATTNKNSADLKFIQNERKKAQQKKS